MSNHSTAAQTDPVWGRGQGCAMAAGTGPCWGVAGGQRGCAGTSIPQEVSLALVMAQTTGEGHGRS